MGARGIILAQDPTFSPRALSSRFCLTTQSSDHSPGAPVNLSMMGEVLLYQPDREKDITVE